MFIVDRRLNPGSKSLENRQRFLRRAKALRPSSCAPPLASPAFGVIKVSAPKPVIFSRRSTAGSPKVSTRLCCKTPRRCLTSWRDSISCLLGKMVVKPHRVTIFVKRLLSRDRAAS
jgi:hypothetical protein